MTAGTVVFRCNTSDVMGWEKAAVRVLLGLLQPPSEMLKGIAPGNVVHEQRPGSTAIVRAGDTAKGFLPRRVPNLELDLRVVVGVGGFAGCGCAAVLVANGDHAGTEFHTNRQIVHGLEALVGELQQQAGLADA